MTTPSSTADPSAQLKLISREMIHSLNNMLFVINGYTHLIKEAHLNEETLTNLKKIEAATLQSQKIMADWREKADKLVPDLPIT